MAATITINCRLRKRRKKQNVGGPGRTAAPVVRRLSRAEAEAALEAGTSATRAAYAFCYAFETQSGNLKWLRSKAPGGAPAWLTPSPAQRGLRPTRGLGCQRLVLWI